MEKAKQNKNWAGKHYSDGYQRPRAGPGEGRDGVQGIHLHSRQIIPRARTWSTGVTDNKTILETLNLPRGDTLFVATTRRDDKSVA